MVIDAARRTVIDRIKLPHVVEGLAISPDGGNALCLRAGRRRILCDRRAHAMRYAQTVPIDGADASKRQMRRVRVSPDNKYVVVSSNQDDHAAIYQADGLGRSRRFRPRSRPWASASRPTASTPIVCCHDDAEVFEFELATGRVTRTFATAAGCEFIVGYHKLVWRI